MKQVRREDIRPGVVIKTSLSVNKMVVMGMTKNIQSWVKVSGFIPYNTDKDGQIILKGNRFIAVDQEGRLFAPTLNHVYYIDEEMTKTDLTDKKHEVVSSSDI
jgi:hypothetical protein